MGKRQRRFNTTIGERVRMHRKLLGITQEELSTRTGIDSLRLSRIELGRVRLLADEVRIVAAALGVSFEDVLGEAA